MSEQNKAVVRGFLDGVIGNKDVSRSRFEEFVAPNVVPHHLPPGFSQDAEGWRGIMSMFFIAFPDLQISVEDMVAEGDRVALRWTAQATHSGDFMDISATAQRVSFTGMIINRISGGKIAEHWEEIDMMSLMQQIGAIPAPGA